MGEIRKISNNIEILDIEYRNIEKLSREKEKLK